MNNPTVTLSNGVVVANFSSPHPFTFVDGTVLPACEPEVARSLMLDAEEIETPGVKGTTDLELTFKLSEAVYQSLVEFMNADKVDIVLVPLPVLQAVKNSDVAWKEVILDFIRCVRVADRVTKAIHIDRFCR